MSEPAFNLTDAYLYQYVNRHELGESCQPFCRLAANNDGILNAESIEAHLPACLKCRVKWAVDLLVWFVQINITGEPSRLGDQFEAANRLFEWYDFSDELSRDGETVNVLFKSQWTVAVAHWILASISFHQIDNGVLLAIYLAKLRLSGLHQELLPERCPSLKSDVLDVSSKLAALLDDESSFPSHSVGLFRFLFYAESAMLFHYYYEFERSKEHFELMRQVAEVEIELTGCLGKRTRFQTKETAQMTLSLKAGRQSALSQIDQDDSSSCPRRVGLDDDTLLERVNFSSPQQVPDLTVCQQLALLLSCYQHEKSRSVDDELINEELFAYLNVLIDRPKNFYIQSAALCMRSKLERTSVRRMERSLKQLEQLCNEFSKPSPPASFRLLFSFSRILPAHCHMQKTLCMLLEKFGATSSALDIYRALNFWDDVVRCLLAVGKRDEATQLIKDRLNVSKTPQMLCLLATATDNPQYLREAWQLSGHRHAASMRQLGFMLLRQKKYKESLEPFERSLEINPLLADVWFSYGCAALASSELKKAVNAFHRCTTLNNDSFQAWANLSAAYARLGQLDKAQTVLLEAIKCNYDDWRLWENYLTVSARCKDLFEAIRAYHRLLDLNDKYEAADLLHCLVSVVQELPDNEQLRKKTIELFARIASSTTVRPVVWALYADLLDSHPDPDSVTIQRTLDYRRKALGPLVLASKPDLSELFRFAPPLLESLKKYSDEANDDIKHSIRLIVRNSVLAVCERQLSDLDETMTEKYNALKALYESIFD